MSYQFLCGEKVKVIAPGERYDGIIGEYHSYNAHNNTHVIIDNTAQMHCIADHHLYPLNPQFKVGDKVGSTTARDSSYRWTVVGIDTACVILADHNGQTYPVKRADWQVLFLDNKQEACQHDWKRVNGFRFDSFCCKKCPATRQFDPTKDDAA